MNKRAEFIYKLIGRVRHRQLNVASPRSKYTGQEYYKLHVVLENQPNRRIQVFKHKLKNLVLWETIQQAKYGEFAKKKYLFKCQNIRGFFYLVDWEELAEEPKELAEVKD